MFTILSYFRAKVTIWTGMTQSNKKLFITGAILLTLIVFMLCRGIELIVGSYAKHKLDAFGHKHHLSIRYERIRLTNLNTICIEKFSVVPYGRDTLLHAYRLQAKLNRGKLLTLTPYIENIEATNLHLHFIKKHYSSNFDCLYETQTSKPITTPTNEKDYTQKAKRSLDLLFNLLPSNASIKDLCVSYQNDEDKLILQIPDLESRNNRFSATIHSRENKVESYWVCKGAFSETDRSITAQFYADKQTKVPLPFLEYRLGASIRFDTLSLQMHEEKTNDNLCTLKGLANINGLTIHQKRISPDTVSIGSASIRYQTNIGKNFIEVDSISEIRLNQFDFHPYLKMSKEKEWHIAASVNKTNFPSEQIFSSLPHVLFHNLQGIKTTGHLSYRFLLDLDFNAVDSLILESSLKKRKDFQILAYGNTDLRKMNSPFEYTAYEQGEPVRRFEVGPSNPSFRPYNAISRYLPLAIMQSEDAGFFQHSGFIPSAIQESLIQDIKERRFARGGSTISMQLVKNVFLSRNKTIARKLEEILIVWLIENNRLTSKERMFEVYLNIAEWGPLIYGATEAAHFYFAKEPSQLNLAECIFMASIIPKPKHVRSCFDGLTLKSYYNEFFKIIIERLISRELITPEEAIGVTPESVIINGPAKEYLIDRPQIDIDQ